MVPALRRMNIEARIPAKNMIKRTVISLFFLIFPFSSFLIQERRKQPEKTLIIPRDALYSTRWVVGTVFLSLRLQLLLERLYNICETFFSCAINHK
jgi:hypothetical protein